MNKRIQTEVPCSICGAEHDPNETPEVDSTHLCASCALAQRALARHAPYRQSSNDDAE